MKKEMLKTIFKNIEGREWDWFGEENPREIHIADLLANPSWCKAVWGEKSLDVMTHSGKKQKEVYEYMMHRGMAFEILADEGEEACLDYIYKTMNHD